MRHDILLLGVLTATLSGPPLHAQTQDEPAQASPRQAPAKAKPKPAKTAASARPAAAKPAPLPPVPVKPPQPPVLPPPIAVPVRPMPPPAPAAVVADATGSATPQSAGLRITFGAGSSDLNPATEAAIRSLARAAPPFAATTFSITATAPGTEEDPSTPRRLSLSRALAVRSVLITEGIASARIYVKAMGANQQAVAGGPPDRADVAVVGAPQAAPQAEPPQSRGPPSAGRAP